MTCEGVTKKGARCKKLPLKHNKFCYLHVSEGGNQSLKEDFTVSASNLYPFILYDPITPPIFKSLPIKLGIRDVDGDGYCFWRALSVCLNDTEDDYKSFLYKCMAAKKEDEIISYTWVEFHEIPIIAKILKINISVVHFQQGELYVYFCHNTGEIDSYKYISIDPKIGPCIYFTGNHYMSIVLSKNIKFEWEKYINKRIKHTLTF